MTVTKAVEPVPVCRYMVLINKLLSNEIAMICQSPIKMIITSWQFHQAIKKQIIN
jgi:hypothetical protein